MMTKKIILSISLILLAFLSFSQTDTLIKIITKTGYEKTVIGQTLIQNIIKENGTDYTLKSLTHVSSLANIGGGCIKINGAKKFYRYKKLGITYIVSSDDTVSGIIFYPPFNGQTNKSIKIKTNKITDLDIPKKDNKIIYSHPDRLGFIWDVKFSENANRYFNVDEINYGFKIHSIRRKLITEIRIGH